MAALLSPARSGSQSQTTVPRGWNVVFYDRTKYQGNQKTLKSAVSTVDPGWARRVKSAVIIGQWELCTGVNFTGECLDLRSSVADLKAYGFSGPVKSIRPIGFTPKKKN
ncbi:MAG TPA: beta/gamma crystallin-related protein [Gemmatimonadaceae bacterium]